MAHAESKRAISALCEEARKQAGATLSPDQAKVFDGLLDEAKRLGELRNDNVHAVWTMTVDDEPLRVRPRWDKEAKTVDWDRSRPVFIAELRPERERIDRLWRTLDLVRREWPPTARLDPDTPAAGAPE